MTESHAAIGTTVGAMIRLRRKRKGISLRELAERVGVGASTMSRWERDREFVPQGRRWEIAQALDFDAALIAENVGQDLTIEERRLLRDYRALPAPGRNALTVLLASLPHQAEGAPC